MVKFDFGVLARKYPYPDEFKGASNSERLVYCPFVEECPDCTKTNFPKCDKYLSKVGYINSGMVTI